MADVVRGPAARSHARADLLVRHAAAGSRAGARRSDPTEPVPFVLPDGRVAVVVHPPKRAREDGAMARDMYWRIRPRGWTKLKESTRPTWPRAEAEARAMLEAVMAGLGDKPQTLLRDAIAVYLERHTSAAASVRGNRRRRSRGRTPVQWSRKYAKATRTRLDALSKALGDVRCGHLTYATLTAFLGERPSFNAEDEMCSTLSALTRWLTDNSYVLPSQALDGQLRHYKLQKADTGGRLGALADAAYQGQDGSSPWFVRKEEVPNVDQVHAVARALPNTARDPERMWYLQLMALTAAYVGLRLGELIALTCDDVVAADHPPRAGEPRYELVINVARQHTESNGAHIDDTKGRRGRSCIVPIRTPGCYPLTEELRRRVEEARNEMAAGTNPAGLLFPSTTGRTMWWRSNLRQRHWYPASAAASWPTSTLEQARRALLREQIRAGLDQLDETLTPNRYLWTFHTLRHVAARYWVFDVKDVEDNPLPLVAVSQHLGHASTDVTERIYVGGQLR